MTKKVIGVVLIGISVICGFFIGSAFNIYKDIKPINVSEIFSTNGTQLQQVDDYEWLLTTTYKTPFALNGEVCVKGENNAIILPNCDLDSRFILDVNNNKSVFSVDGVEYIATIIEGDIDVQSRMIENEEGAILFSSTPIGQNESLLIFTQTTDKTDKQPVEIMEKMLDGAINAKNLTIKINNHELDLQNVEILTDKMIGLDDNSFISADKYNDAQITGLKKIYGQQLDADWSSSKKIPQIIDKDLAVRVIDNIKYMAFMTKNSDNSINNRINAIIFGE